MSPYNQNPYGGQAGAGASAIQGFLNSYLQMRQMLVQEQYRQSLMELQQTGAERAEQQLGLQRRLVELKEREFEAPEQGEGLSPGQITQIRKEAKEGVAYETPEEFYSIYNPEQDPVKQRQLESYWEIGHREEEPSGIGQFLKKAITPPIWSLGKLWGARGRSDKLETPTEVPTEVSAQRPFPRAEERGAMGEARIGTIEAGVPELDLRPGEPLTYDIKTREPRMLFGKKKSPYSEYPDAFMENNVWKVMRRGKKYRIE